MKPQRSCIACRNKKDKDQLLRVVIFNDEPVLDIEQKYPGRGCYVCDNEKCIEKAINRNAFSRALKTEVPNETLGRVLNGR